MQSLIDNNLQQAVKTENDTRLSDIKLPTLADHKNTNPRKSNIAVHPVLSPFMRAFQKRFENLQYQFERVHPENWQ